MTALLLLILLILALVWDYRVGCSTSKKRPRTLRWMSCCNCVDTHCPGCYAGMEHWEIGITFPGYEDPEAWRQL